METSLQLLHPFRAIIAGPSQAGKSTVFLEIIHNRATCISPRIKKTIVWYAYLQDLYSEITDPDVHFVPSFEEAQSLLEEDSLLIIGTSTEHSFQLSVSA